MISELPINGRTIWYRVPIFIIYTEQKDELFLLHSQMAAFMIDSSARSHPIRQEVNTPDEIFSLFDPITYDKVRHVRQIRPLNERHA